MIAGSEKGQAAAFGPENKAKVETGPTFEIILAKPANAQTRMKMRFSNQLPAFGLEIAHPDLRRISRFRRPDETFAVR